MIFTGLLMYKVYYEDDQGVGFKHSLVFPNS